MCLCDTHEPIRDLAHLFFHKLAERSNNPIYNLLGDIIATLSRDRNVQHIPSSSSSSASAASGAAEQSGISTLNTTTTTGTTTLEIGKGGDVKPLVKTKPLLSIHSALTASQANQDMDFDTESTTDHPPSLSGGSAVVAVAAVDIDEASLPQRVLSPREFQSVMQFLLGFVKKDKQADGLLERLLVRLSLAQTNMQRRNLAYCISELPALSLKVHYIK